MSIVAEPPLRCAVLVPAEKPADMASVIAESGRPTPDWIVLHANCDVAAARAKADEWSRANPGETAVVMVYDDHVVGSVSTDWAKR